MMVNFAPYISQFWDDQRQLVVGGGIAQAPGLKNKRRTSYSLNINFDVLNAVLNTATEICNPFKLTPDAMRLYAKYSEI